MPYDIRQPFEATVQVNRFYIKIYFLITDSQHRALSKTFIVLRIRDLLNSCLILNLLLFRNTQSSANSVKSGALGIKCFN